MKEHPRIGEILGISNYTAAKDAEAVRNLTTDEEVLEAAKAIISCVDLELKVVLSFVPRPLTTAMIATETPAAAKAEQEPASAVMFTSERGAPFSTH